MVYLIACIISSTSIFVIFRLAKNYSCKLTSIITLNYFTATFLGLFAFLKFKIDFLSDAVSWLPYSLLLGVLFIALFFLIGSSSQKAGITITTLANKLSLVFPVLFSLIFFQESISTLKYIGLITAFIAIFLTVYKKEFKKTNILYVTLPLLIFLGGGITDSIVKYVQALKTIPDQAAAYSTMVFFVAFIIALIISVLKNYNSFFKLYYPTLLLGILLGICNFGSLYFMINALNKSNLDSSMVFAINNMSVVAISALLGFILFKEKLSILNRAGLLLALVALYFLI